jgi:hypothetical protein
MHKMNELWLSLSQADREDEIEAKMNLIREKHRVCVGDVLSKSEDIAKKILEVINKDLKDIMDLLRAVQLMRMAHEQILVIALFFCIGARCSWSRENRLAGTGQRLRRALVRENHGGANAPGSAALRLCERKGRPHRQ